MKFVGLVSGGKDSLFNILHCLQNGHELTALANLHPPEGSADELDSFMYQTVGYHALTLYGECLGKPLYRGSILGSSKAIGLEYEQTEKDETEDLYLLLKKVKDAQPDVEAVSVGAILSNYQRTRVEDVCNRLGLVCLAFLWQRSQDELLDEIIGSGVDARIIKTAAVGLGRQHLGKSLGQARADLVKYNQMYGIHVCGEGGEYETLVIDAPIFKKRLKLHMDQCQMQDFSSEFVSYLEKIKVTLEDKADGAVEFHVPVPDLLKERFQEILNTCDTLSATDPPKCNEAVVTAPFASYKTEQDAIVMNNVQEPNAESVEHEVRAIFEKVQSILHEHNVGIGSIASVTLLVKDMADFGRINSVYQEYFKKPLPPARLCIETHRIPGRVQLSAVAGEEARIGIHVQGRSYWAPANIGPYSQAIFTNNVYYLSGQIGLVPASMQLHKDIKTQSILALQNLVNVAHVQNCSIRVVMCFVTSDDMVPLANKIWENATDKLDPVPELARARESLVISVVDGLPKGAAMEWAAVGTLSSLQEDDVSIELSRQVDMEETQKLVFTTTAIAASGQQIPVKSVYNRDARLETLSVVVK